MPQEKHRRLAHAGQAELIFHGKMTGQSLITVIQILQMSMQNTVSQCGIKPALIAAGKFYISGHYDRPPV
jgi:hypothetical protein